MRTLSDHTNGEAETAYNFGAKSNRAPKQMSLTIEITALHCIREEKLNPGYPVQGKKQDFTRAFNRAVLCFDTDDMVELATKFVVIMFSAVCDFGGAQHPVNFEVIGSAVAKTILVTPWPEPARDGELVPRNDRSLDFFKT